MTIDEFSINTSMTRSYARAPKGERAVVTEPFEVETKLSVISAMSQRGIEATMTIEGSVDSEVFNVFVKNFLTPRLKSGDVVIMDNIPFHHNQTALDGIKTTGAQVEHLPAYSPDFNPIEHCISKIKSILRRNKARTRRKLEHSLVEAINQVTTTDIKGWFNHCGYVSSYN